jgi:hypothetical protein
MDRAGFKKHWMRIGILLTAAYILVFLFLGFTLRSRAAGIKKVKNEIKSLNNKLADFNKFYNALRETESKKKEVKEAIKDFYSNLISGENIEQKFLNHIGDIAGNTKIKLDRVSSKGADVKAEYGYEKYIWDLSFSAGYGNLVRFLSSLETSQMFLGAENLDITGGADKPVHKIEMSVYAAALAKDEKTVPKYDVSSSTAVLNLPQQVHNIVESIKSAKKADSVEVSKDPLYYGDTVFPHLKYPKSQKQGIRPPQLSLEGIIWDPDNPMAVINGKVMGKGDSIKGARIVKIGQKSVTLVWRSKYIKLNLKGG